MMHIHLLTWILLSLIIMTNAAFTCNEEDSRFQCTNGQCISIHSKCDFRADCTDNSDELNCTRQVCDPDLHFSCDNGKCIPKHWICDERNDCFDNSDEESVMCESYTCPKGYYQCRGNGECIKESWVCDGDVDCDDEDDEDNCNEKIQCTAEQFKCNNGECVAEASYQCDGEEDCRDGSDEENCNNHICTDAQFRCKVLAQCIPKSWQCDTTADCEDETDEANCTRRERLCPTGYFSCMAGNIRCIPQRWKCDGNPECTDNSDELHCDNIIDKCAFGEFHCHNQRQCIPENKRCDGTRDCIDYSDETDCPGNTVHNKECPTSTHFRCPGSEYKCISKHELCDNTVDCEGGEDEKKGPHFCGYNECEIGNGNCSHGCNDLRLGYECVCPAGYKLSSDQKTCKDIDECKLPYPQCSQFCINTPGSYRCACWTGYEMESRTKSCKATNASYDVSLFIADKDRIKRINLNRNPFVQPVLLEINVGSMAIDIAREQIYWTDPMEETISRSSSASKSTPEILIGKPTAKYPTALSFDWVHKHLYWADVIYGSLSVANADGSYPTTLMTGLGLVSGTAVHPIQGFIFIALIEMRSNIQRCGLDGKDCQKIIEESIHYPSDVAVDYDHDLVYWVDSRLHNLAACDINGNNRRNLRYSENFSPFSVAVFSGRVYWSDFKHRSLFSTNSTGGDLKVIDESIYARIDIEVLHPRAQPTGTNRCAGAPCKYLCLPKANISSNTEFYSCRCPDHYTVKEDDPNDCKHTVTTEPKTVTSHPTAADKTSNSDGIQHLVPTLATSIADGISDGTKVLLAVGIIALLVLVASIACLALRWHKRRNERLSMNFNNPIYRKVNESTHSSLTVLDDQPVSSSSGEIRYVGVKDSEPTAGLILNEEVPSSSGGRLSIDESHDINPFMGGYAKVQTSEQP